MTIKSFLLMLAGILCLSVGAVGIFLPVLPTTPFVLLAAGCFGSSNPRLYGWLLKNKYFGAYILNYKTGAGVPKYVKVRSLLFLWGMMGISILVVESYVVKMILFLIGLAVTAHILLLKTKP